MPFVTVHKGGQVFRDEVADNTNLVVRAGIRKFPYPNFKYKCGMGKCATCTSLILKGGENLPEPNWKEKKTLGDDKLGEGLPARLPALDPPRHRADPGIRRAEPAAEQKPAPAETETTITG